MIPFRLAVRRTIPLVLLLGLLLPSLAVASPIVPGFNGNTLPANDDGSTGSVSLGFAANFFGTSYTNLFVNNNGNVTFNTSQSTYTPTGLGSGYSGQPIIAPFFADVDTRGSGSGIVSYGTGTYNGNAAFGVNWPDVGYYGFHTDKLNNFQLLLVSRPDLGAGDFDIYFNYQQIQWETGDASGGSNGFGGTPAAAGYNAGSGNSAGTYYQIPGSLTTMSFEDTNPVTGLIHQTNDGVPGQFLFEVVNGQVVVPAAAPEPASLTLLGMGAAGLFGYGWRRRKKAN